MTQWLSLATDAEGYCLTAEETKADLASSLPAEAAERFRRRVDQSRIRSRRAHGPLRALRELRTLEVRQATYAKEAPASAERVARRALRAAGLDASDVDVLIVASSTGQMVPTLDAHLAARVGLRPDVRAMSLEGLGCAGGVRAAALAAEMLRSRLCGRTALVVSVELCSIWLQVVEPSPEDILSNIVFGDGAAALVLEGGPDARGPEVLAARSVRWADSLEDRGARLTSTGWRHFASPALPRVVRRNLRRTVDGFLADQGVSATDIRFHAVNPSDPRLLETMLSVLHHPAGALEPALRVWEERGNTLSAGPFYVLRALQAAAEPEDNDLGLVLVLGPGVTCDMLLLRWRGRLLEG